MPQNLFFAGNLLSLPGQVVCRKIRRTAHLTLMWGLPDLHIPPKFIFLRIHRRKNPIGDLVHPSNTSTFLYPAINAKPHHGMQEERSFLTLLHGGTVIRSRD